MKSSYDPTKAGINECPQADRRFFDVCRQDGSASVTDFARAESFDCFFMYDSAVFFPQNVLRRSGGMPVNALTIGWVMEVGVTMDVLRQLAGPVGGGGPYTVLFTAVRNEAPFLIEWIAYHKAIGFDRIIVYANASDDGTEALLEALHAAGEVEYVFHEPPERVSAQGNAARLANESGAIPDGAWALWLDADEFLNVRAGSGRVVDLVRAVGERQGILICWRLFGTNGMQTFPGRFISAQFSRCSRRALNLNTWTKTLFRWKKDGIVFSTVHPHRPQINPDQELTVSAFVNGNGRPLKDTSRDSGWVKGGMARITSRCEVHDRMFGLAQINHYCVRTIEHYLLKRTRGDGLSKAKGGKSARRSRAFFFEYDRNEVEETSILRQELATTAEMERLRGLAGVAEAEARALRLTEAMIAAIPPEEFAALTGVQQPEAMPRPAT